MPNPQAIQALTAGHSQAKALFDQTSKATGRLDVFRRQLDQLAAKGLALTPEDVIESAGKIVASGALSAGEMAGVLASMPEGGQALASWVGAKAQALAAKEKALEQTHSVMRHEVGASALRLLAGHAAIPEGSSGGPGAGAPRDMAGGGNSLMPGGTV